MLPLLIVDRGDVIVGTSFVAVVAFIFVAVVVVNDIVVANIHLRFEDRT